MKILPEWYTFQVESGPFFNYYIHQWIPDTFIASLSNEWNYGKEAAYVGFRCTGSIPVLPNCVIVAPVKISGNAGIVFYDSEDKPVTSITTALVNNEFKSPNDSRITCMRISDRTKGSTEDVPTIKYKESISEDIKKVDEKIDLNIGLTDFESTQLNMRLIDASKQNPFIWKPLPKAYFSFTHDDANEYLPDIWTTIQEYNFPFCPAVPPNMLNTIYAGKSVKDICNEVVAVGGEVLSHGVKVLTGDSSMQDYLSVFRDQKRILSEAGFDVNGIIMSGGTDSDTIDFNLSQALCLRYYQYSDLYGTTPQYMLKRVRKMYWNQMKELIDTAIANKEWVRFFMHRYEEIVSKDNLILMFNYLKLKQDEGLIEVVNWKYMFDTYRSTRIDSILDEFTI